MLRRENDSNDTLLFPDPFMIPSRSEVAERRLPASARSGTGFRPGCDANFTN